MAQKQSQNQGDIIRSFTLGNKELEGKTAEFLYDRGQYSITDIVGEERSIVYKSRNAQEAYTKWNVYIGRKKERPEKAERPVEAEDKQNKNNTNNNSNNKNRSNNERKTNERQSEGTERHHGESNNRRQNDNGERRQHEGNSGNGGYNQGFTAVGGSDSAQEKSHRRNRHRRNHRKEQEN